MLSQIEDILSKKFKAGNSACHHPFKSYEFMAITLPEAKYIFFLYRIEAKLLYSIAVGWFCLPDAEFLYVLK